MNAFGDALVRAPPHPRNDVIRKTSADAAPQKHGGARETFFLSFFRLLLARFMYRHELDTF